MASGIGVSFMVGAALGSTISAVFATVESRIKKLSRKVKELQTEQTAAQRLVNAQQRLGAAQAAYAASPAKKLKLEVAAARRELDRAEKSAAKWNIAQKDSAAAVVRTTAALKKKESALARNEKLQRNQAKRKEIESQMISTVASFAAVAVPVRLAVDFESAFADVKKVVDFANAEEERGAQADIRNLSGETGISASGIAGIYAAAGAAKLATTREELKSFADTAARMAVAFGMSAEDAGRKMASWRSKMGMSQQEVVALSDAINHLGNNMAADPLKTAEVVERMGAVAKGAGLSAKSIAALSASFVAASPSPEIAATGMKNFLLAMTKGDALSNDQRNALAALGVGDPASLAAEMQKDAEGAIMSVMQSISEIPREQQGALLSDLFGSGSLDAIQPLLENLDMLRNAFGKVADEQDYAGSMSEEYGKRTETAGNSLLRLHRTMESLAISVGGAALPLLTTLADGITYLAGKVAWLAEKFPWVTNAVFGLVAGFIALKPVVMVGTYFATIFSDIFTIGRGLIMLANPLTLIVVGVVMAVAAVFTLLYNKIESFRKLCRAVTSFFGISGDDEKGGLSAETTVKPVTANATAQISQAQPMLAASTAAMSPYDMTGWFGGEGTAVADLALYPAKTKEVAKATLPPPQAQLVPAVSTAAMSPYDMTDWFGGEGTAVADLALYPAETEEAAKATLPPLQAQPVLAMAVDPVIAGAQTAPSSVKQARSVTAAMPGTAAHAARGPAPRIPAGGTSAGPIQAGSALRTPLPAAGGAALAPQVNFSVNFSGIPSKDVGEFLMGALKSKELEMKDYFGKMIASIASDQRRVAI